MEDVFRFSDSVFEYLSAEQVLYDTKDSSIYLLCNYCQDLFVFKLSLSFFSFLFYDGFVVGKTEASDFPTTRLAILERHGICMVSDKVSSKSDILNLGIRR